ncbi:MAG: EF-hand domain-containing protein [Marinobacter sp.]|uniref:hypothetical protein n=1 Tax=Marinobacter sp. TaxID=50741 RepID=UPI0034A08CA3
MFKQLLISTAISTALISTPLLAQGTSMGNDNPQTTGQTRSGPNDAGGQASTNQSTDRSIGTTGEPGESKETAQAGTSSQSPDFDSLDQNKDGQLDEDELNRFGDTAAGSSNTMGDKEQSGDMLQMYDRNDDGSVSKEELESGPKSRSKDKMTE